MSPSRRAARLAAAFLLAVPAAALAQGGAAVGSVQLLSGVEARGLSFNAGGGVKGVTEFAVPLGMLWTASPRLAFDFGVHYASITRTPEAGSGFAKSTVSGLTDAQVRGAFQLVPDIVILTVAANLPTGKTKLSLDEQTAVGAAASDLVPFPVASFGSGANVTTGLAVAVPVAGWAVGAGGSYRLTAGYTPIDSLPSYKPGGELRVRVGADRVVGQGRVSLGFTYSTFAEDEFNGARLYQPGRRYIVQGAWSFPVGNLGLGLYAWDLYRAAGTLVIGGQPGDRQNVVTAGATASIQMGRNVLRPQLEYRSQSAKGAGDPKWSAAGHLLSLSARYQLTLSERFALIPAARFDTGNLATIGTTVGFTGWGLSVGLRAAM